MGWEVRRGSGEVIVYDGGWYWLFRKNVRVGGDDW